MLPARPFRPAFRAVSGLRSPALRSQCFPGRWYSDKKPAAAAAEDDLPDHRKLGVQQELFTSSLYSPGSPIFLPNGTRIFNRLVDFLRRQYVHYGFDEVITPNIYKKSLWEVSGHLQNYADDMYTVTSRARAPEEKASCCGSHDSESAARTGEESRLTEGEDDDYGLKPMNCPGHCLIFASKNRSYRDLPIRYADFSPLHRNEISGALSGLTRVRRFHQDDGHVFCRPIQIQDEVFKTLDFMKTVYGALGLEQFDFALSTRPADHYIGTDAEWARAESQLRDALEQAGLKYTVKEGDGAFYGPKIDVMLHDSHGKSHQAGTIQLDFQLPQRFNLEYQAPAPQLEAQGLPLDTADAADLETYGPVPPVMIHRAILGSVERLMALLIEEYKGKWPFWLNPRQCVILTINDTEPVMSWASEVKDILTGHDRVRDPRNPRQPRPTGFAVEIDSSARSLAKKLKEAREKQPGFILVVGKGDVAAKQVTVDMTDGPDSSGGSGAAKGARQQMDPLALLEKMQEKVATYQ
ncbi:threonyl-tRNA synthetase [Colletotrichum orchidophilum]|uniref:threonine--tRNA ligase n=1 Tax=Colletotrichum orchidophilum TaxID=1209926 RepID=A0A1G4AWM8_9PEZI|nr:threonyl-tRNA synthetase [Colletotrichum orchidophilum]OHE93516.1 threonyl-tRNA synthetase [Colletotrichum orchidophilum]